MPARAHRRSTAIVRSADSGGGDCGDMTDDATGRPVPEDPWIDITPQRPDDVAADPYAGPFGSPAGPYGSPTGPYLPGAVPPAPPAESKARGVTKIVGLFAAGAVAGGLVVGALNGFGTHDANTALVTQNGQAAGAPGAAGQGQAGQGQQGQQGIGPGGLGGVGGQGGAGDEQHITGTVTAVSGSSLSVKSAGGTATYTIVAQTQIVRGNALADASAIKTGDTVLVHVFPAQGSDGVLERVFVLSSSGGTTSGASDDDGSTT